MTARLADQVPPTWRAALASALETPSFATLEAFVARERADAAVFPQSEQVFAALEHTPLASVRAVIFGQDPYPTRGNANGLAFSVGDGVKVPASLRNLFAGLALEFGLPKPSTGNLTPWARHIALCQRHRAPQVESQQECHRECQPGERQPGERQPAPRRTAHSRTSFPSSADRYAASMMRCTMT